MKRIFLCPLIFLLRQYEETYVFSEQDEMLPRTFSAYLNRSIITPCVTRDSAKSARGTISIFDALSVRETFVVRNVILEELQGNIAKQLI